ncbi:hypothetical protein OQA88_5788 [Cercophora sp. LCS_1]
MPPKRGVKRPLDESDGNAASSPTTKSLNQTSLSFARSSPAAKAESPKAKVKTPTPKTGKPKTTKTEPAKPAPKPNKVYADDGTRFAKTIAKEHPTVRVLSTESPMLAPDLMMFMADHCYGDLDFCFKNSGWGDTDGPFEAMDKVMLELLELPKDTPPSLSGDYVIGPSKGDFGTEYDAEEKALRRLKKGKRPNKQERGCWHARREKVVAEERDWAGNALNDLAETRQGIEGYGIGEQFFRKSIKALAALKGVEFPESD